MNATELLKQDHRAVAELFSAHDAAGEKAFVEKREIADRILSALDVHTQIEEEIFYPAARDGATGETEALLSEAYEEHQVAKRLMAELRSSSPTDEHWDAKMKVLKETIEHHVGEEENELFPKVRETLGAAYLQEVGERMEARKRELSAPNRSLSGSLVKMVTRAYDSLTGSDTTKKRSKRPAAARKRTAAKARATKKSGAKPKTRATTKTASAKTKRSGSSATTKTAKAKTKRSASRTTTKTASAKTKRSASRTTTKTASAKTKRSGSSAKSARTRVAKVKRRVSAARARVAKTMKTARKRVSKARRGARR